MAKEFTYEVLATYAENDGLKVRSVSFNNRDPKFDIRHWSEKNGEEMMGKGVTLTIEELKFLATELPKVYASLTGGTVEDEADEDGAEDDSDPSDTELNEEEQKFVTYLINKAPADCKGITVKDGITYATEKHMLCALKGVGRFDESEIDIEEAFSNFLPDRKDLKKVNVNIKELRNATKLRMKKGSLYSFGAGHNMVDAEWIGKSVRSVGANASIYTNKANNTYVVTGDNGTVIVAPTTKKSSKVGVVKVA